MGALGRGGRATVISGTPNISPSIHIPASNSNGRACEQDKSESEIERTSLPLPRTTNISSPPFTPHFKVSETHLTHLHPHRVTLLQHHLRFPKCLHTHTHSFSPHIFHLLCRHPVVACIYRQQNPCIFSS